MIPYRIAQEWTRTGPAMPGPRYGRILEVGRLGRAHLPLVRRHLESLRPESRYLRFGSPVPRIDDRFADRTCPTAPDHGAAWGAFHQGLPVLLGTGCLVRVAHDPGTAEFAITVLDSVQGRGIGRLLLRTMAVEAPRLGIQRLAYYVLGENRRMLRLLAAAGVRYRIRAGAAEGMVSAREFLQGLDARPAGSPPATPARRKPPA